MKKENIYKGTLQAPAQKKYLIIFKPRTDTFFI